MTASGHWARSGGAARSAQAQSAKPGPMPADNARKTRLATVEAGRGLAALAVVLFHANAAARHIGHEGFDILSLGEHGVDFFFVLSGFIIFFVHRADIGCAGSAGGYMMKRFIRIYPLLWLVVASTALAQTVTGNPPSLSALGTSLLLYPSAEPPVPLVVWTLRHEIVFYLAFLALIVSRRGGTVLLAAWTAAVLVQAVLALVGAPVRGIAAMLLSSFQIDFVLGAAVAWVHGQRRFRASLVPLVIGVLAVVAALAVEELFSLRRDGLLDYTSVVATWWTMALGVAFALLLHGLLCAEGRLKVPAWFLLLGAASYATYLVHTPLNSVAQRIAAILPPGISHAAIFCAGALGGIVVHLMIEQPLTRRLRARLPARKA